MNISFNTLKLYNTNAEYIRFIDELENLYTFCKLTNIKFDIFWTKIIGIYHYVYVSKIESVETENQGWFIIINNLSIDYFNGNNVWMRYDNVNKDKCNFDDCLKIIKRNLYN